jgi:hypothetical protein
MSAGWSFGVSPGELIFASGHLSGPQCPGFIMNSLKKEYAGLVKLCCLTG